MQVTDALANIVVIMVEPRLAINVGTVVRAMKNMGLTRLRLVCPAEMDLDRVQIAAHRTQDIVDASEVFDDLDAALVDCHRVVGLTARPRKREWTVALPRERCPQLVSLAARGECIALVFGRERTGLSNDELGRCDEFMTIPTREDYSSLNLAQAVLLIAYECFLAANDGAAVGLPRAGEPHRELAPAAVRARLLAQVQHTLDAIGFFKSNATSGVVHTLRRVFSRAELDTHEAKMLLGIFAETLKFAHLVRRGVIPTVLAEHTVTREQVEALEQTMSPED